jgi:murein DD-endopeptidase MepM/ murein hydrolase activator NlpD
MVSRGFEQSAQHRHDGIDILAAKDSPIRAAADGEVLFSDWGPGGYGRMVILRHQNGLVTLYAHNERNLVQVGQKVRQGESIATVGKTGRATAYHVHFEIRQKTVPVSPLKYLPPARQMVRLETR